MCSAARRLIAVLTFTAGAAGCTGVQAPGAPGGIACTLQFVYGLSVIVQDTATGRRVCDAQVTAVSGAYRETLVAVAGGSPDDCSYAGAGERAGVYELNASRAGYLPATLSNVRVDANECHVIPVRVTLDLKK
jgi:hypothetical protein